MKIRSTFHSLVFVCLASTTVLLHAQGVRVQQFDQQQQQRLRQPEKALTISTNAPELYPGENDDVGPQAILRLKEKRTHFEALVDSQYTYTDNNRLTEEDKIESGMFINTAQFALAPTPYRLGPGLFSPRLGFRSQWYNYGFGGESSEDVLDFNAQTVFLGGLYQYEQKWEFGAGFEYNRLLDQKNYDEFYVDYVPALMVQRYFILKENMVMAVSWQGMYHFSTVDPIPRRNVNDRLENSIGVTLSYQPTDRLVLQPFYRFQHTYYPDTAFNTDRNDLYNIFGGTVSYYFTRQFSARAFASYTMRETDDQFAPSYRKFDAGAGASLVFKF